MKKIFTAFLIICCLILIALSVSAQTLPDGDYQYQDLEGSQVHLAHSPSQNVSYVVGNDNTIFGGPYKSISDYGSFPYAENEDGSHILYDHDGSVIAEADATREINPPENGIYSISLKVESDEEFESPDYTMTIYDYDTRQELCTLSSPVFYWLEQQTDKMVIKKDGKYAFINKYGELQSNYVYDEIKKRFNPDYEPYPKAYAIVVQDGAEKYIDFDLNEIDFDDSNGEPFITNSYLVYENNEESERYCALESGSRLGLYDKIENKYIIPLQEDYDAFVSVSNNYITVKKGDLYGIIDFNQNLAAPLEYSYLNDLGNDFFMYQKTLIVSEDGIHSMERGVLKGGKKVFATDKNVREIENGMILVDYPDPNDTYEYAHNYTDYVYEIVNFAGHALSNELYTMAYFQDGKIYVTNDYHTSLPEFRELNIERDFAVINLNGSYLPFDGVIKNDRTLVPMREIVEGLGGTVEWNDAEQSVHALIDGIAIDLKINSDIMTVGDCEKTLDVPAQIINHKTMLPLRAIAEAIGADVDWDDKIKCVYITR